MRRRCPKKKARYRSKLFALLLNSDLQPPPTAYLCPHCGAWHVTRRSDVGDLAHEVLRAA